MNKQKRIRNLVLNFGFAEDSYVSTLLLQHEGNGFASAEDALADFANDIFEEQKQNINIKQCCRPYTEKNFCAVCGNKISGVNLKETLDYFRYLPSLKSHEFFFETWRLCSIAEINIKETCEIMENAEYHLLKALKKHLSKEQQKEADSLIPDWIFE